MYAIRSYYVLHALRHVLRGFVRVVRNERSHAQPLLGDPAGFVVRAARERILDLSEREQVVTHVDKGVLAQLIGKLHDDATILGRGVIGLGSMITVLVLRERQVGAAKQPAGR